MAHSPGTSPLHVHDLPQIYTKPSASILLETLELLRKAASSFTSSQASCKGPQYVDPAGVPGYLTGVIASSLEWLSEEERERVWESASLRLSERAGRTAAPAMTRSFVVNECLTLELHEPSLTGDSLGLKTWTSSLLLARQLQDIAVYMPANTILRALELGAGTGLVGLAMAATWYDRLSEVMLTDLPEIVPNLTRNVQSNRSKLPSEAASMYIDSRVLDWADQHDLPDDNMQRYSLIVAADPIYSDEHPRLLMDTIRRWLDVSETSRVMIALPLRDGYAGERQVLSNLLEQDLERVAHDVVEGHDDWEDSDGQLAKVRCEWSIWRCKP